MNYSINVKITSSEILFKNEIFFTINISQLSINIYCSNVRGKVFFNISVTYSKTFVYFFVLQQFSKLLQKDIILRILIIYSLHEINQFEHKKPWII